MRLSFFDRKIFKNLAGIVGIQAEKFDQNEVAETLFAISAPSGQSIHESWHPLIKVKVDDCPYCVLSRLNPLRLIPEYGMFFLPEIVGLVLLFFLVRRYAL